VNQRHTLVTGTSTMMTSRQKVIKRLFKWITGKISQ
jgi:hypothetical protein